MGMRDFAVGTGKGLRTRLAAAGLALCGLLAVAVAYPGQALPAPDAGRLATTVAIPSSVDRTCFDRELGTTAGTSATEVTPPLGDASYVALDARLTGPKGSDWDLAVFDQAGHVVAASAEFDATEVASGYVLEPGPLTVQVCRISGSGSQAQLNVAMTPIQVSRAEKDSLVNVKTPRRLDVQMLDSLGLDMAEHGGDDYVAVVLHGAEDRAALERVGLDYTVEVANMAKQGMREAQANARFAARAGDTSLPSGNDHYRRLFEYQQELKDLAKDNPDIVRPITLNHETWEGRTLEGIEITTNVNELRDGKPVFINMGLHHAREWPSGEHSMEWAYQMVKGYNNGNERVIPLVKKLRTIVIPVVNVDGFNASREAGEQQGGGSGRDGNDGAIPNGNIVMHPNEYRRKNCRFADDSPGGNCLQPALGVAAIGVDPNRNYGAFWGGPGASGDPSNETYYGPGPFSEPETQDIRELVSERQVTVLITNHTFSDLVLRAPGLASEPPPYDEVPMKALGDAMAHENGYASQHGWELYDTTGTTEDWSYNTTGGFGYTFEIGCNGVPKPDPTADEADCIGNFHPTYPNVIAEWSGTTPFAQAVGGSGNQEAYFLAAEAAIDPKQHSVLQGQAPPGAILRIEKRVETPTSQDKTFTDHLQSELKVPDSGSYDWHINPSTRPLVAKDRGRVAQGPLPTPSPETFSGLPGPSAAPCADFDTEDETCWNDHPFEIPNTPGTDVDSATVRVQWSTPGSDWDMKIFRDTNGDGSSVGEPEVAQSGQGTTDFEETTFISPETPAGQLERGKYVVRMQNYAAAEPYDGTVTLNPPEPFVPARTETWSFTCTYAGQERVSEDLLIARGERKDLDLSACGLPGGKRGEAGRCQGAKATIVGSKGADKMIGTKGVDVIIGLGGDDKIKGRGGDDLICAKGGDDTLIGGGGEDTLGGGGGRDAISGGGGNDKLKGGARPDELSGGGGKDRLIGGGGRDKLNGGAGKDRCTGRRDRIRHC
jgi:hypothetical protein